MMSSRSCLLLRKAKSAYYETVKYIIIHVMSDCLELMVVNELGTVVIVYFLFK